MDNSFPEALGSWADFIVQAVEMVWDGHGGIVLLRLVRTD